MHIPGIDSGSNPTLLVRDIIIACLALQPIAVNHGLNVVFQEPMFHLQVSPVGEQYDRQRLVEHPLGHGFPPPPSVLNYP